LALVLDTTGVGGVTGLTFVDAGGDDKISSGDYFVYTGTASLTITIIYSNSGTNTPIADGTL
jgi:hypothetical protein